MTDLEEKIDLKTDEVFTLEMNHDKAIYEEDLFILL